MYDTPDWTDYVQAITASDGGPSGFTGGGYEFIIFLNHCSDELCAELNACSQELPIGDETVYRSELRHFPFLSDLQARILSWCPLQDRIEPQLGALINVAYLADIVMIFNNHAA